MVIAAIVGYLLGSIPVAVLVGSRSRLDPRLAGDRNPGWWNSRTVLGKRAAWIVFAGDILKGAAAAGVGLALVWSPWWTAYVGIAFAMIGHAFPIFAGFHGGKSILTFVGGVLVVATVPALLAIAIGTVVGLVSRKFSIGGQVAFFAFPISQAFFQPRAHVGVTGILMTFIGLRFLASYMSDRATFARAATLFR